MTHTEQRRLAAILSLDVVGYARMMGRDEAGTLAALRRHRDGLIDPLIAAHRGRIVKTMGDGLLVEFASVTDAVECAIGIQDGMTSRAEDAEPGSAMELRIGINLGDILGEGEDIFGDGVNLAARLQSIAEPGGISLSGVVRDQVAGRIGESFEDLGYRTLKNIAQPVRVYARRPGASVPHAARAPGWPHIAGGGAAKPLTAGGCLCGAVRYEVRGEPAAVGYCHCRFCQLALGAPLNAWAAFEKHLLRFVGEPVSIYKSSAIAERGFCGRCGTSIYTDLHGADGNDYYSIRLATLDDPQNYPPTVHFGVESKLPWLDINDALPRICTADDPGLAGRWAEKGEPPAGPKLGTAAERAASARKDGD